MRIEAVVHRRKVLSMLRVPRLAVWVVLGLAVLAVMVSPGWTGAQTRDLFNNFNSAAVATGPNLPPLFGLGASSQITELVTYHWNNGRGATPGTISLRSSYGQIFGPFPARGEAGQGGAPNVNWVATANVTVPAGFYTVLDSDPNTGSYNQQSSYRHFAIVRGSVVNTTTTPTPMPTPQSGDLFNNFNTGGTLNGGVSPYFTLNASHITELVTYHWNNGQGATPGNITLRWQNGKKHLYFGPFAARGESGQGGARNVVWVATVNVNVPAGSYIVIDSDPNTWSRNSQSQGRGFTIVRGTMASAPAPPPSGGVTPPPPSPGFSPWGGNCPLGRPGCVHPDLTAFGGCGPYPLPSNTGCPGVSLPGLFASGHVMDLAATTTVPMLAAQCKAHYNGTLTLVDDQKWYYYFSGRYARFVCK